MTEVQVRTTCPECVHDDDDERKKCQRCDGDGMILVWLSLPDELEDYLRAQL